MAIPQARANQLLDALHAVAALVAAVAPIKMRQMTAAGSATANGTELPTGGGYTAGTGAPTITFGAAAAGTSSNSVAVTITNMPQTTIPAIELWDNAATPIRQEFGNLTAAKTTAAGDTLSYAQAAVTSALA